MCTKSKAYRSGRHKTSFCNRHSKLSCIRRHVKRYKSGAEKGEREERRELYKHLGGMLCVCVHCTFVLPKKFFCLPFYLVKLAPIYVGSFFLVQTAFNLSETRLLVRSASSEKAKHRAASLFVQTPF